MGWVNHSRPRLERGRAAGRLAACALLAAAALTPLPVLAQDVDTGSARALVALLERGSVAKLDDMDFGKIAQSVNAGTVVLLPQASAVCTTTGGLIRTGVCRAARFAIMGRRNNRFRVRHNTGGQVTLNGPGGATMSMTNITIGTDNMTAVNGANGWNLGNYRIDRETGVGEFYLGGTLNVGAAQAPGVYNGVVVIDIQLN